MFFPVCLQNTIAYNLQQVYDMMLRDERYYPSFKQSPLYVRMLAELDMLKEPSYRGSDDGDGESFNGSPTGSINLVSFSLNIGLVFMGYQSMLLLLVYDDLFPVILVFGWLAQFLPWWIYAPYCLHLWHRYTHRVFSRLVFLLFWGNADSKGKFTKLWGFFLLICNILNVDVSVWAFLLYIGYLFTSFSPSLHVF